LTTGLTFEDKLLYHFPFITPKGTMGPFMSERVGLFPKPWPAEEEKRYNDSWDQYVETHYMARLWAKSEEKEQDRYRDILQKLSSDDARGEKQGAAIMEQRELWVKKQRDPQGRESLSQHRRELDDIDEAANAVLRHETLQNMRQRSHKKLTKAIESCRYSLQTTKRVWLGGAGEGGSVEAEVTTNLNDTMYYLGHAGGDYIFRYREPDSPSICAAWDTSSPVSAHPSNYSFLDSEEDKKCFTYEGLVPRTWKEYAERFAIVCQDVAKLLGAILCFGSYNDGIPCNGQTKLIPGTAIRGALFTHLRNAWCRRVLPGYNYLYWVQSKAKHHPRFWEFAFLLKRLDTLGSGFANTLKSLVNLVEMATGMTMAENCAAFEWLLKGEAERALHVMKDTAHCLLYDDDQDVSSSLDMGLTLKCCHAWGLS
jgi:hypothetical protein